MKALIQKFQIILKRHSIESKEFTQLKKDEYNLVKHGGYLKGRLIAHKKCKNGVLSIPAIVIKYYEGGLFSLRPSVDIYDFVISEEYFEVPECLTVLYRKQYVSFCNNLKKDIIKKRLNFH